MMETDNEGINLPVKKKPIKPNKIESLLKRSVLGIFNDNPVGVLYSLIEKESFHIEIVEHEHGYKGLVYIDGTVFEGTAIQKKKARERAVIRALEHVFKDVIQAIRKREVVEMKKPEDIISTATLINATLQSNEKSLKLHPNNKQNNQNPKKIKINTSDTISAQIPIEKEIINHVAYTNDNQDDENQKNKKISFSVINSTQLPIRKEIKSHVLERVVKQALGLMECENPNTVTALYTLFDKDLFHFDVTSSVGEELYYQATLHILDRVYTDIGNSMRKAKSNVTRKALRELFPEIANSEESDTKNSVSLISTAEITSDNTSNSASDMSDSESISQGVDGFTFSDFVASAIQSKYDEVMKSHPSYLQRYSVLSGIMMVINNDLKTSSVICVSTGERNFIFISSSSVYKVLNIIFIALFPFFI